MEKRHQSRGRRKPRANSSDVLPASMRARPKVAAKWRKHFDTLRRIHSQLTARKAELGQEASPEGHNPAVTNHIADTATDEFDRDLAVSMLSSEQDALYEIESAIRRIEDWTYGICELSGKKIDPERLAAIPWTRFSAEAEKELERRGEIRVAHLSGRATVAAAEQGTRDEEDEEEEPE